MNLFNDMWYGLKNALHEIIEGLKRIFNALYSLIRDTPVLDAVEVATLI